MATCKDCVHIEVCAVCPHDLPVCDSYMEVVRCKDCKYWWKANELCRHEKCCDVYIAVVDAAADHYCGYGERKEQ